MVNIPVSETGRLSLRGFRNEDFERFATCGPSQPLFVSLAVPLYRARLPGVGFCGRPATGTGCGLDFLRSKIGPRVRF